MVVENKMVEMEDQVEDHLIIQAEVETLLLQVLHKEMMEEIHLLLAQLMQQVVVEVEQAVQALMHQELLEEMVEMEVQIILQDLV